jgi:hypothetical protein
VESVCAIPCPTGKIDPKRQQLHDRKFEFLAQQQRELEAGGGSARWAISESRIESFLKSLRDPATLRPADIPELHPKKPLEAQLEAARAEVESAKRNLVKAERLPRDLQNVKDAWAKQFADLQKRGEPDLSKLFRPIDLDSKGDFAIKRPHGKVRFATMDVRADTSNFESIHFSLPDSLAFDCWWRGDEINQKMLGLIDEYAAKISGVSVEEKARRVAESQDALVAAFRLEDAVCMALECESKYLRTREVPTAIALGFEIPSAKILAEL